MSDRVVLAYSGGLDTSVAIGWIAEQTGAEVIACAVDVPVIASGGAGSASDVCDAITRGHADAALVAGIVHDRVTTVREIKRIMTSHNLPVRVA